MKKSKLETAETRRRIVKAAAAEFRRNGIHATGLCELMAAAGLTHGGFYRHFDSKDQLIAEACAAGMEAEVAGAGCRGLGKGGLTELAASYLSTMHRDNPGEGCLLAGLGSELEDAARLSGAAPLRIWLRINGPLLAPAIALSFIATFAEVLSDFGLASTIARMSNFGVLTYGIYAAASDYPVDFPAAGAQAAKAAPAAATPAPAPAAPAPAAAATKGAPAAK